MKGFPACRRPDPFKGGREAGFMPRPNRERNNESASERAWRQLFDGVLKARRRPSEDSSTGLLGPLPVEWRVPDHIRRLLNCLASEGSIDGYTMFLDWWLSREGIAVPSGLFS